jgi:hypothetical protein
LRAALTFTTAYQKMTGMLAQTTTAVAVAPGCSDAIKTKLAIMAQLNAPMDAAEGGKREAIDEAYWQLRRALRADRMMV